MSESAPPSLTQRIRTFARTWRNASYSTLDHAWLIILWAISTPIFIRNLGEDAFGIWILISSLVGMGAVFSFGFGEATVRFVSKYHTESDPDRVTKVVEVSLTLYAISGAFFGGLVFVLSPWIATSAFDLPPELQQETLVGFRIASYVVFITAFLKTLEAVINGFQRYDITARVGMVLRGAILLVNVWLALIGYTVSVLVMVTAIGLTLQTAICYWIVRRHFVHRFRLLSRPDGDTTMEILRFGFQIWLQMVGGALSNTLDRFLVGGIVSPAAAGVYAVCLQLSQQIHLLLTRALAYLLPAASEARSTDGDAADFLPLYRNGLNLTLLVIGATVPPLIIMAPQVLTFWVGPDFAAQGTQALQGLAYYFALMATVVAPFYMLNGMGKPEWNTVLMIFNGVVFVALALFLMPRFGLMGAVYARLLAFPFQAAIFIGFHRHAIPGRGWAVTLEFWGWLAAILGLSWAGSHWSAGWAQLSALNLIVVCLLIGAAGTGLSMLSIYSQRLRGKALR